MRKVTALLLATTIGLVMAMPAANAFNPQPDPPGKSKAQLCKRVDPVAAKGMIIDGCKTTSLKEVDPSPQGKLKARQFRKSTSGPSSGAEKVGFKEVDPSPQGKLKARLSERSVP
jgi:hypothetical protein